MRPGLGITLLAAAMPVLAALGCRSLPGSSQADNLPEQRGQSQESSAGATSFYQEDLLPAPRAANEQPAELPPEALLGEPEEAAAGSPALSLEAAVDRLLAVNPDLAARQQDIPKARADVVTAGLRSNPVVFLTASPLPYGRFSAQRPGATTYDITVVQALDVSGKHRTNKVVAQKNVPIVEAHYQDAVRLEIDRLGSVYVSVLEAQALARAARDNLEHLGEATSPPPGKEARREASRLRLSLRQATARIAVQRAEASLLNSRRNLAVLLALPPGEGDHLHLCGSLHDRAPPPPPTEELIEIACRVRPDLLALRMSVERAGTVVRREKAEAMDDLFLFFSPYQALDSTSQGLQVSSAWEAGLMIPIPSLSRNQGKISRAQTEVMQWRLEVEQAEQELIGEVRQAAAEYAVSREMVEQYERFLLPGVRQVRREASHRLATGEKDVRTFLSAQHDYEETVHGYVEALARHRRAMLRLNTAVGQRILP